MPANILNLDAYKVLRIEHTKHDYHIAVQVSDSPKACVACGSDHLNGHGRYEQVVRDLPIHGKRVAIYVDTRRMRCPACGKTFMEPLPNVDANRRMTDRLLTWIGQQSLRRTFASIAQDVGLDESTVRDVFRDYVAKLESQFHFETPQWMGIDEIHLIRPRCVISNIHSNTIVNLLPNRDKKTVAAYLRTLQGKDDVQYVAIDMWRPYRDAAKVVMPGARIIIDKFHVVRMANKALEQIRKDLRSKMTIMQRRGLMHDRFTLLRREHDLNEEQRFLIDGWTKNYPTLGLAYRLKEDFYGIYEKSSSREEAMRRYESWARSVTPEIRGAFGDLIRAWQNWTPYILNYFEHPITNAFTESLNNLIRVANRMGRGYSFEALRAKILFTKGVHKHDFTTPKFERMRNLARPHRTVQKTVAPAESQKSVFPKSSGDSRTPMNYGADITTLAGLIASGDL
jgi:transposase